MDRAFSTAQLIFPGFRFGQDDPAMAERLVDLGVGGFCLYRGRAAQVHGLTQRLQRRARVPLLFCADYEDGAASHVEEGTALPSNMALGAARETSLAYRKAVITAVEARAMGVRWVFAPVIDLAERADNPIVNVRSFGADPRLVAGMAGAYMRGLRSRKVLSCAKHFPGHGGTREDSHLELPTLASSVRGLARDLLPFRATAGLADSVMLAHLYVPAFGDERGLPATLSRKAVDGWLRKRLGYEGLAVTDALDMRAVSKRYPDERASWLALHAGADILLVPQDPLKLARALPALVEREPALAKKVSAALARLNSAKRACGLLRDGGLSAKGELARVGCPGHWREAELMAEATMAWAKPARAKLPSRVRYLEPETTPRQWRGRAFLRELRRLGISVTPYARGGREPVVAACFLGPRAYSGRIALEPAQARRAGAALKGGASSVFVSFGSPFLLDQVLGYEAGLCAFSGSEPAQKAAARVLAGAIRARGRLPVPLKCLPG